MLRLPPENRDLWAFSPKDTVLGPHPRRAAVAHFLLPLSNGHASSSPSPAACLFCLLAVLLFSWELLVHVLAHVPTVAFFFMVLCVFWYMVNTNLRFQIFSLLFLLTVLRMPPLSVLFISMLTNISFITIWVLLYITQNWSFCYLLLVVVLGLYFPLMGCPGLKIIYENCDFDVIVITCHILICSWVFLWILLFFYLLIFLCSPLCEYIVFWIHDRAAFPAIWLKAPLPVPHLCSHGQPCQFSTSRRV